MGTREQYRRLRLRLSFIRRPWVTAVILVTDAGLLGLSLRLLHEPWYPVSQLLLCLVAFHSFVLLHEAGHGLVSRNRWINTVVGHYASLFCAMPFQSWRRIHLKHHQWAGDPARDPTLKGSARLVSGRLPWLLARLADLGWRTGVPLSALSQHGIFWFDRLSNLWLVGAYASAIWLWPELFTLRNFAPAAFLYLVLTEIVNFPHHAGLPPRDSPTPFLLWEQHAVTRTCRYPLWISRLVLLNFNLHVEHHLFPDLPWHELPAATPLLKEHLGEGYRETPHVRWSLVNRRRPLAAALGGGERRPSGRLLRLLPRSVAGRVIRNKMKLELTPPPELEVRLAGSGEELEQALRLLHQAYVASGYSLPEASGIRVTEYHTVPTTSVIVALWENQVVGTLSLIQDSLLGCPMEATFDLRPLRRQGRRFAEVSALAVKREFRSGRVLMPLTKYLVEYARHYLALDTLVFAVHPRQKMFYEAVLLCRPMEGPQVAHYGFANGNPAVGLRLDIREALERAREIYANTPDTANLSKYYENLRLANLRFPARPFRQAFDPTFRPDTHAFLRARCPATPPLRPLNRFPVFGAGELEGGLVQLRNLSRGGCQIRSAVPLELERKMRLVADLGEGRRARLLLAPRWRGETNVHGCAVLEHDEMWDRFLTHLERQCG